MPAIEPDNVLTLPRITVDNPLAISRPVTKLVRAKTTFEGEGFMVRRPFPGGISMRDVDPFLLLDQMGGFELEPEEAKGTPWHPHRGFETVTYMMDGQLAHQDTSGGGGTITDGSTQWMTAGSGILHIEQPSEYLLRHGGMMHGVQLWVNLPAAHKMSPPKYQGIEAQSVKLLTSADGGAVIRLIAGDLAGHVGPGSTFTPITYAHITLSPGARVELPWNPEFNAMVYALNGSGTVGIEQAPLPESTLAIFGAGDSIVIQADGAQMGAAKKLDVLVLGGKPIGEPVAHYGPFVMNTHAELVQAVEDFQTGRMGVIPPQHV